MLPLYNLFIRLYYRGAWLLSFRNKKAKAWIQGRTAVFQQLEEWKRPEGSKTIWIHCASAGELEQGKPVIAALRKEFPHAQILLTLFSPSGVAPSKKAGADLVTYLPLDTASNAKKFIDAVNPSLVLFIKYEYWYHHLRYAAFRHVPVLLVSAIFRKDQIFFKEYGGFFRSMLFFYRRILVQDEPSKELLANENIHHVQVIGDTRFDRVIEIAKNPDLPQSLQIFCQQPVLIAGSTWEEDEALLQTSSLKKIIVPHELNEAHLNGIRKRFPNAIFFTEWDGKKETDTLVLNTMGLLSRLYSAARITYVGGGFNKEGIHNVLEAAVWGKPVIIGPNYHKFREAVQLKEEGALFPVQDSNDLNEVLKTLNDDASYHRASEAAKNYVYRSSGATEKLMQYIQENRLLTKE